MRRLNRIILGLALWFATTCAGVAAVSSLPGRDIGVPIERHALVIGNGVYQHIEDLPNTVNDAKAMAAALADVGFNVIQATDLDREGMQDAIGRFLNAVTPGSEALLYYAGHGVELEGQNYLLPTNIRRLDPSQQFGLRSDGISLTLLMEDLQAKRPRVSLFLLDACRNNPFPRNASRGLGGRAGLANIEPPQGTIVIYAAGAGESALDSLGESDSDPNGLFTRNLLSLIKEPGLEIRPMVQELKERVYSAALSEAQHTQRPSYYDGLIGKFYFLPEPPAVTAVPQREDDSSESRCDILVRTAVRREELLFLDTAVAIAECRAALRDQPQEPRFAELLRTAEEQRAAQVAFLSQDPVFARAYIALYPSGTYLSEMELHLASLMPPEVEEPQVVAEPEPEPEPEPLPEYEPRELALLVQTELNRLGCSAGTPDGIWGGRSERALQTFQQNASIDVDGTDPSPSLLVALQKQDGRVCPLTCSVREVVSGDRCVAKTCPAGQQLSSRGQCYTPQRQAETPAQRPSSGGSCFEFNGQTFCE